MTTTTATTTSAAVYRNSAQEDWGLGVVVEDRLDRWVLVFEHAGRKTFMKAVAKTLVPVTLEADALEALQAKAHRKHASSAAAPKGKTGHKKAFARFISFDEQLRLFDKLFAGGFDGEHFSEEDRGVPGAKGKVGYKAAAIALARQELSADRFKSATPQELFESAVKLLSITNIVFPIEGAIPFKAIAEADRAAVVEGLQQLLHGEGEYAMRLERFSAAVNLKSKDGQTTKRMGWPLSTAFGALFSPDEHVCVKPTPFAEEGATLGMVIPAAQPVSAAGYRQFLDVAKEVQKRLLAAGHKPKDLVDVYSFIWRTHKEKPG